MSAIMILRLPIGPITQALSGDRQWQQEGLGKIEVSPARSRSDQRDRLPFSLRIPHRLSDAAASSLTSRTVDAVESSRRRSLPCRLRMRLLPRFGERRALMYVTDYRGLRF
jgi:hypothetical protein